MDNKTSSGDFPLPLPCPLNVFCLHSPGSQHHSFLSFTPFLKNYLELLPSPGTPYTPPFQPNSLVFRPKLKSLMLGVGENIRISWKDFQKTCLPLITLLPSSMCRRFLKNELFFFFFLSDSIKMLHLLFSFCRLGN